MIDENVDLLPGKQLTALPIPGAMPDLARSLDLVRTQRTARERSPERAAAPAK